MKRIALSIALATSFAIPAFAQSTFRDGAGNPLPRTTGTPGRSGSYSGTGYAGGSVEHGLASHGETFRESPYDNHFGDRVR